MGKTTAMQTIVNFTRPSLRQLFYSFSKRKMSTDSLEMKNRLVWVDLEMTGLDDNIHHIIEAACLITDKDLNIVAEGPNVIIHQPEEILNLMDDWCTKTHRVRSIRSCEKKYCQYRNGSARNLKFCKRAHITRTKCVGRKLVKELCRRWYPEVLAHAPVKSLKHRAMDDIRESINELKFYRNEIFKS